MLRSSHLKSLLLFGGVAFSASVGAHAQAGPRVAFPPFLGGPLRILSPDLILPAIASQAASSNVSIIIQYQQPVSATELQQLSSLGASTPVTLKSIGALQVSLPSSSLKALAQDNNIRYISMDRALSPHGITLPGLPLPPAVSDGSASIATTPEYTVQPINAPTVWSKGYLGTGIGVAVIDSGISANQDLLNALPVLTANLVSKTNNLVSPLPLALGLIPIGAANRVVYNQDFVQSEPNDSTDHYGHGTHVAGLIGGAGISSYGPQFYRTFLGVAPNVNLINLRVLDSNGAGTDTAVIQAIDTAIALKNTYNIRVINLSLGRPIYESYTLDPLCQELEQAWKAGIVVVVAAGNDGRNQALNNEAYGTIDAPGNDPYALTVGATNTMNTPALTDDVMASYSSKGPSFIDQVAKPDLVAPGNLVTSLHAANSALQSSNPTFYTPMAFYQNGNNQNASQNYMPLSGTSMATGVTSGAVALLLSANPNLTPDQVKAILMHDANKGVLPASSTVTVSGVTYTDSNDVFTQGAGYLDIAAAVADAKTNGVPAGTAMSPIANYDPNSNTVSLIPDSSALWGGNNTYSASGVYGANAFVDGSSASWAQSNVNASSSVTGTTALWGRTALNGASDPNGYTALWGSTALWGRGDDDAATALWGRTTDSGSTALWGRTTNTGSTALWGRDTLNDK